MDVDPPRNFYWNPPPHVFVEGTDARPAQIDETIALKIKMDAEAGNADAQYRLAALYLRGNFFPKSQEEAFRWALASAKGGNKKAQGFVAFSYESGSLSIKDPEQALHWLKLAGAQGEPRALYNLSVRFRAGSGVPLDIVEANRLLELAAAKGNDIALPTLAKFCVNGTDGHSVDIARAISLYEESVPTNMDSPFRLSEIFGTTSLSVFNLVQSAKWFIIGCKMSSLELPKNFTVDGHELTEAQRAEAEEAAAVWLAQNSAP